MSAANFKQKPWRSPQYRAWIASKSCAVCGKTPAGNAHHAKTGGMGTKCDDKFCVPLCGPFGHHDEIHRIGKKTFEAKYHKDLLALAERLYSEYQRIHGELE